MNKIYMPYEFEENWEEKEKAKIIKELVSVRLHEDAGGFRFLRLYKSHTGFTARYTEWESRIVIDIINGKTIEEFIDKLNDYFEEK